MSKVYVKETGAYDPEQGQEELHVYNLLYDTRQALKKAHRLMGEAMPYVAATPPANRELDKAMGHVCSALLWLAKASKRAKACNEA